MSLELSIEGIPQVQAELARLAARAKPIAATQLAIEAEVIMAESKQQVPVDTGVLRASGHVLPANVNGDDVEVTLGYGGAAEAYAVIQHENLNYRHTVGNAKFLERPLMEAARGMGERLVNAFRTWR